MSCHFYCQDDPERVCQMECNDFTNSPHATETNLKQTITHVVTVNVEIRERSGMGVERVKDLKRGRISEVDLSDRNVAGNDESGTGLELFDHGSALV